MFFFAVSRQSFSAVRLQKKDIQLQIKIAHRPNLLDLTAKEEIWEQTADGQTERQTLPNAIVSNIISVIED